LHIAAYHGHFDIAQFLIEKDANINSEGFLGNRPLHIAAINGHLRIVKLLITKSVDVYVMNAEGDRSLDLARQKIRSMFQHFWQHICYLIINNPKRVTMIIFL
jgi:ankyrin repeat protein